MILGEMECLFVPYKHLKPMLILSILFITVAYSHRDMQVNADASQSTISGTGAANFEVNETVTITIQAVYANGTNKLTGGDIFVVKITNECEKNSDEFECYAVTGQLTVLATDLYATMTDNGNGTYSYDYTATANGNITISVFLLDQPGVYVQFYNGTAYTPPTVGDETATRIEFVWANGEDLTPGYSDSVSARMYTYIRGPATQTINFEIEVDDWFEWFIDGGSKTGGGFSGNNHTDTHSMTQDQYYNIRINLIEGAAWANLTFQWNYTGQAHEVIPDSAFYVPTYVSSTPLTIEVLCPTGHTGAPTYTT